MSYNPYQQQPGNPTGGLSNIDHAKNKIKAPAILMIISGVIGLLSGIGGGGMMAATFANLPAETKEEMLQQPDMTPELLELVTGFYIYGGIALTVLSLIGGILVILAGVRMLSLKNWGLGLTGSIFSMIPCFQPCCLFSIPIGIYVMVVLCDPQVKSAFK